jgi:predicted Ser/Thr protein kinase
MTLPLTNEKSEWLKRNGYTIESHLAHGKKSCVWKVKYRSTTYVLKTSHPKSDRWLPLSDEAAHLQDANRRGVGPKLVMYNLVPDSKSL